MTAEVLKKLLAEDRYYAEEHTTVDDSGWDADGKYQLRSYVLQVEVPSDRVEPGYYRVNESRSGSYYSDYEYYLDSVEEVVPYTETITVTKYRKVD